MLDPDATRAAARALYEGQGAHFDVSDEAIMAALSRAGRYLNGISGQRQIARNRDLPPSAPRLDAGQLETALRSVPQICGHCRLLSDAPERPCPSPRGHYFMTDYAAMAEKLRTLT